VQDDVVTGAAEEPSESLAGGRRARPKRSWWFPWIIALLVICTGLVAVRLIGFDRWIWWSVPFEISTPLVILPTLVVAVALILGKRWRTLVVCALVLALQIWWLAPQLVPTGTSSNGFGFRVFSANIEYNNPKDAGLASQISQADADIVILQELSPGNLSRLEASKVLDGYAYSTTRPGAGFGTGVWSKWPLQDERTTQVGGFPFLTFQLATPQGNIRVVDVHTLPPEGAIALQTWRTQLSWLARQAKQAPGPLLEIGDFNATQDMQSFRGLLAHGHMKDAHRSVGGWRPTWPANRWWLPPIYRFDHVLLRNGIGVSGQRVGHSYGSDHLPLVTDLRLQSQNS
jgi:endonuclease/exonuclease/phosphatase (EEP) superfamily protein YafD